MRKWTRLSVLDADFSFARIRFHLRQFVFQLGVFLIDHQFGHNLVSFKCLQDIVS
jgi:hypothetical protein